MSFKNPICPLCNKESVLVDGSHIYMHRSDLHDLKFYRCPEHQDYYVGCHKGTTRPLGVLANQEHRKMKMACHKIFDQFWINTNDKMKNRGLFYRKLAYEMGCHEFHFGEASMEELKKAYGIVKRWQSELQYQMSLSEKSST